LASVCWSFVGLAGTLEQDIEAIRTNRQLPSLAVLAVKDGQVRGEAAVGVRKLGSEERVTVNDQWHIGSCTKSMTATLAALYVQKGKLKWNTTVGEIFPEWSATMNGEWRGVTLEQLLTHRSGAPGNAPLIRSINGWSSPVGSSLVPRKRLPEQSTFTRIKATPLRER
jgi:CubicO group peptidase (beta-lactamase class C family)